MQIRTAISLRLLAYRITGILSSKPYQLKAWQKGTYRLNYEEFREEVKNLRRANTYNE